MQAGTARAPKAFLIVAFFAVVLIAVIIRGYLHRADAADTGRLGVPPPAGALTTLAKQEDLPIYLSGIGTVQAALSVTVKVRVDGQLESVGFREGQAVRQGDLLAQIDPAPYQASLDAALAQQARDEANYANSLVDLKRYADLVKQDSIAQQTYDTQVATVASLKAAVGVDRAQVETARVNLAYTTIHSPIPGVVGLRLVDPGNIVHATDTTGLVVVNQVDPISVVFSLPESNFQAVIRAIAEHGKVALATLAYAREDNELLGTGQLLLINNQIDPGTGTVQLKATFPNPAHRLWPGQYVNVHVVTENRSVVTIPSAAVQRGVHGLYAFVVKPDETAALQPIVVALQQDGKAIITSGIAAGERVVVDGQFRLRPGIKVVETKAGSATAGAASSASAPPPDGSAGAPVGTDAAGKTPATGGAAKGS
jgi:multidrug efflux system membrane fusion protein